MEHVQPDELALRRIVQKNCYYPNRVGCEYDDLMQEARIAAWQHHNIMWAIAHTYRKYGPAPDTKRGEGNYTPRPTRRVFRTKSGGIETLPSWLLAGEVSVEHMDYELLRDTLYAAIESCLTEREREAILRTSTDAEIAARRGCSKAAVSMARTEAKRKLKRHPKVAAILNEP